MFVVGNRTDPNLYWSNENGWVDPYSADRFTVEEQRTLNLPIDGYWVALWSLDIIQFARFIAECEEAGVFVNEQAMTEVECSMDLSKEQIFSIIDRAQNVWEEAVAKTLEKTQTQCPHYGERVPSGSSTCPDCGQQI